MPNPSYARPTSASLSKGRVKKPQTADPPTNSRIPPSPLQAPPQKLKRPSPLSPKKRQTLAYNSTLIPIKPQDPQNPCPLFLLPSELRTQIWIYVLDMFSELKHPRWIVHKTTTNPAGTTKTRLSYISPPILHISRAIRLEAAYTYYTSCPFFLTIFNLNFSNAMNWLRTLPLLHREFLSRNRNLTIEVMPGLRPHYTYPPADFMVDDFTENHWKACKGFGNLYLITSPKRRVEFVVFCRLAGWFRFCGSKAVYRGMKWRYRFHSIPAPSVFHGQDLHGEVRRFLMRNVSVLRRDWSRVWVRGNGKGVGVEEAREFLRQLDEAFMATVESEYVAKASFVPEWNEEMTRIKKAIEKW